jgi:hypothetical protein
LDYILNPPGGGGDFPDFQRQVESGLLASSRWDEQGRSSPDWNPIQNPKGNWKVYHDLVALVARLDCVAMANFIPWGSRSTEELLTRLGAANRPLLERMLAFADEINSDIMRALTPRLVIVPFSLGRNRALDKVWPIGVALANSSDSRCHSVSVPGSKFMFYTATLRQGTLIVPAVFLRHPASLRLCSDGKQRVIEAVASVIRK